MHHKPLCGETLELELILFLLLIKHTILIFYREWKPLSFLLNMYPNEFIVVCINMQLNCRHAVKPV